MSHPNPTHDVENELPEDIIDNEIDYREKALGIIRNKGVSEWLEVRDVINLEAINKGYCVDIEGCCEEDRCDCYKYRDMTLEQVKEKLKQNHA